MGIAAALAKGAYRITRDIVLYRYSIVSTLRTGGDVGQRTVSHQSGTFTVFVVNDTVEAASIIAIYKWQETLDRRICLQNLNKIEGSTIFSQPVFKTL
jgi:hypothetical protein